MDRKTILLRAAYDLLKQQNESGEVLNVLSLVAYYDDADCDGYCLLEDIANELGIEDD